MSESFGHPLFLFEKPCYYYPMSTADFDILHLSNGVRIVMERSDSAISHACVFIGVGSRYEPAGQFGVAHFIEHLLFKKTLKRSTNQILNRLESVGGDINAYTTKEYTCLHASFLNPYLDRTLDLFEDLLFHSTFPPEEIEKERGVILDEIASYLDSPEDAIQDDFEDMIFNNHNLGHNILGTIDDLKTITKEDIRSFVDQYYYPANIVVGISGNYTIKHIQRLADKYFGVLDTPCNLQQSIALSTDHTFFAINPVIKEEIKPINQVHCMLGTRAYPLQDKRRTGLALLNNILGGIGMSSRLNMSVREKHGIAYHIESNYTAFSDTGLFSIYFGTDIEKYPKALNLINKELNKLCNHRLGTLQLHQAKKKFKGQIALGEENRLSLLITQAKSLFDHGEIQTLSNVFQKIDEVEASDILLMANEIVDPNKLWGLTFVPEI